MRSRVLLFAVAALAGFGTLAPTPVAAEPIYLSGVRRVYAELFTNGPAQEIVAPGNAPFSAEASVGEGDLSALALQVSNLSPGGISGSSLTLIGGVNSTALAASQLLVNFQLLTPHAFRFAAEMAGGASLGAYLSDPAGNNVVTVPGGRFAAVSQEGLLQPGVYQFNMGLTSSAVPSATQGRFQVSLALTQADAAPIPEPATLLLIGTGSGWLVHRSRRRRQR